MGKVTLEHLRKEFGKTIAVEDLTVEVPDKSFVSLLGPSGCGKTTTLNMICGLLAPTSGNVYIDDKNITYLPPGERKIGLVFQDYAVFPSMNGFENIAYGLKIRKVPKEQIQEEVKKVAEFLNITDVLHKTPRGMNQSELQRVALARTLVTKPSILLLDEPLSNLDAAFRLRMRVELKRLHHNLKQTVIYVTHDQIEAMSMSDKIAVMSMGKLQQYGTPEGIYGHPKNRFVAGFIGSPPMNFIEGTYEEGDGRACINQGSFKVDVTKFRDIIQKHSTSSELTLGIRPEDIRILDKPTKESVEATVYAFEPLGSESIVDVTAGGIIVRIIAPAFLAVEAGNKNHIEFDMQKVHILDRKSGEAIV